VCCQAIRFSARMRLNPGAARAQSSPRMRLGDPFISFRPEKLTVELDYWDTRILTAGRDLRKEKRL
jgi:hypothetical protein